MNKHRIFVIWNHPLFIESVRLLLRSEDIVWLGSSSNFEEAILAIEAQYPDTVLIEEAESGSIPAKMLELLETSSSNLRIFRLNLSSNDLKIYHREKKTVLQAEDLLDLIRNGE